MQNIRNNMCKLPILTCLINSCIEATFSNHCGSNLSINNNNNSYDNNKVKNVVYLKLQEEIVYIQKLSNSLYI